MIRFVKINLFAVSFILLVLCMNLTAQTVNIDMGVQHQVIRGFGGIHINSWTGQQLTRDMQEKAFRNAPGELGLSIFRMFIDHNPSGWGAEVPIAQYAISQGAMVFASPWNPPSHMREVLRTTEHGTDYVLLPQYYDAYVDHLNSFISYMSNNGVPLYAISVQNEPDWHSWTWWTPQQMLTFVREHAQKLKTRVIAPESLGYLRTMTDPLLKDSVANSHIDILGTHLYGTSKTNFYYPLAYEKNKEIWMTEHLFGSSSPAVNTWSLAMEMADEINTCMDARMSTWVYWYIRRFYGLIDDAGNITDKGYVLSQFSKFIRPGAHRVQVNFKPVSNVTATAYKTDSTIVVVVVNQNKTPVSLNFNIINGISGIDSLSRFTTSQVKKMVNDGSIATGNGLFSVSVDPFSITTFTSDASQGGKYGNLPPRAMGGADVDILDNIGTNHTLTLKGSSSTDPDGEITRYSWARNGYQVSTSPDLAVTHGIGEFAYVLTVTDNDGATAKDTVNIVIRSQNNTEIWLEAECAVVSSNWDIVAGTAASKGKYLMVKQQFQSLTGPAADTIHHLVYRFSVNEGGVYKVWGRALVPTADDDSFWVKMNDGQWINWNGIQGGNTWQWDDVHNQSNSSPMTYTLEPGEHTLSVCYRENGAGIDKFYITNTGKVPAGLGGTASNCLISSNLLVKESAHTVTIFPNPASSGFRIKSDTPMSSVSVFNSVGSLVFQKYLTGESLTDEIHLSSGKGIYLVQIVNYEDTVVKKLIIE
jgi:glucuronoarabinoxylan endo-1,4-beta-xylanase